MATFHIGDRVQIAKRPELYPVFAGLLGEVIGISDKVPAKPYMVRPDGKAFEVYCSAAELVPLAPRADGCCAACADSGGLGCDAACPDWPHEVAR